MADLPPYSGMFKLDDEQIGLRYKDYADGDRIKVLPLAPEELIRRFLLHALPKGFMRVRHCGFLANRCRKAKLAQIREAIGHIDEVPAKACPETDQTHRCPRCKEGRLRIIAMRLPQVRNIRPHDPPQLSPRTH
ncbi:MAG: hypothetical protein GY948_21690 [Alphaproteobacteria bacterium]|nr:hypothetical protein [Alphaproteobacteria bacterium]